MIEHETMDAEIRGAVSSGKVSATPFVDYVNRADAIFAGFGAIAELLRDDLHRQTIDGERDKLLNINQKDALIGLIQAVSEEMGSRACDIQDWARERIKEGKA